MARAFLLPIKIMIGKFLSQPVMGRFLARLFNNRIPAKGCVIDTSSPLITPKIKAYLFWGLYESAEIRFVDRHLRSDLDVIELGSSLGVVACHIRKRIDAACKLICVEANPKLAELIDQNLKLNKLDKNVRVVNKAIDYSFSSNNLVFFDPGESNLEGMITRKRGKGLSIETATLTQLVKENISGDYVLVSDIEGGEIGIVRQDAEALKRCRQIIIELHDADFNNLKVSIDDIKEALINTHGFSLRYQYGPVCVFEK